MPNRSGSQSEVTLPAIHSTGRIATVACPRYMQYCVEGGEGNTTARL